MNPAKRKVYIRLAVIGAVLLILTVYALIEKLSVADTVYTEGIEIHYLDVGEADSALVLCEKEAMLIDGGNEQDSRFLYSYLKKRGVKKLKYVVCTHSDEDHVGGISGALSYANAEKAYAPKTGADTKPYKNFIKKLEEKNIGLYAPAVGEKISLGSAEGIFLAPLREDREDINNTSIIFKLTYKNRSFLFTGDAEFPEEYETVLSGADLSADVLKVAHHGSKTSSSDIFLDAVRPLYAVISTGAGNPYGHPDDGVIKRLEDMGTEILRTDKSGTVIIGCDGYYFDIKTTK